MKSKNPQFTPPSPDIERRIDEVLGKLTLEEKIDFLGGQRDPKDGGDTYGNKRVGIPPLTKLLMRENLKPFPAARTTAVTYIYFSSFVKIILPACV